MSGAATTKVRGKVRGGGDAPETPESEEVREGKLSWMVGWLLLPGIVALSIFLAGAYVGAHHPTSWITSMVRMFTN